MTTPKTIRPLDEPVTPLVLAQAIERGKHRHAGQPQTISKEFKEELLACEAKPHALPRASSKKQRKTGRGL